MKHAVETGARTVWSERESERESENESVGGRKRKKTASTHSKT